MGAPSTARIRFLTWTRTLHIYVSLAAFVALLFFAVTGFLMNHGDWFGVGEKTEVELTGTVPSAMLATEDHLPLVEHLRAEHGATGPVVELDAGETEIRVLFQKPGSTTDVFIDPGTGELSGYRETSGTVAILAAIHKGDDTGNLGALLIDLTAGLLLFVSISGIVLWTTLPKRRRAGLIVVGVGLVVFGVVTALLVL